MQMLTKMVQNSIFHKRISSHHLLTKFYKNINRLTTCFPQSFIQSVSLHFDFVINVLIFFTIRYQSCVNKLSMKFPMRPIICKYQIFEIPAHVREHVTTGAPTFKSCTYRKQGAIGTLTLMRFYVLIFTNIMKPKDFGDDPCSRIWRLIQLLEQCDKNYIIL